MRIVLFLLLFSLEIFPQQFYQLLVKSDAKEIIVEAFSKNGLTFLPVEPFSKALQFKYKTNIATQQLEITFPQYVLKVRPRNSFVILQLKKDKTEKVMQLPVSTVSVKNQLYLPLEYAQNLLEKCIGSELSYIRVEKEIVKTQPPAPDEKKEDKEKEIVEHELSVLDVSVTEKANGTLVKLNSNKKVSKVIHTISGDVIKITFPGIFVDEKKIEETFSKGLVKEVEAENTETGCDLFLSLRKNYSAYEFIEELLGKEFLVTIHNKKFAANTDIKKEKWNFDVIVIDAGHGGKDYGAIGVNNTVEKEINLAVALKVGKLVKENLKDVKVVYTRSDDHFVELYKRGKIANENEGKLFISIHCNAAPKKKRDPNGFEVYLLRPGRTEEAIGIAERENKVIEYEDDPKRYQKLTDENFILVSMAHSSSMKYSEKFADMVHRQFEQNISLTPRGVKQAGFYVLVGASMPSVLVETGYVSNPQDAAFLKSEKGQQQIAQSVVSAIKSFKSYYDRVIDSE
ncbi:MAG: N-acetylmuramoyl-L-alanine amidase [Ignavibacteriaceae bacterium]|jgi:N-acetylmuramoyl-L-alanine amidase